jgi:hypothetical protein
VFSRRLGRVYGPDTGFVIADDPPTVRVPDVAFVRADRLPPDRDRGRFLRVPPDLVVEILSISPSESGSEVLAKGGSPSASCSSGWSIQRCERSPSSRPVRRLAF